MDMHILVVNINGMKYTRELIKDLLDQSVKDFSLTLVDQGSTELGTKEYLASLSSNIEVICLSEAVDLNKLWNNLFMTSSARYLCFLNNDMRISHHFVRDVLHVFEQREDVGIVVHTTNHRDYQTTLEKSEYVVVHYPFVQGYDFTIRKSAFIPIPHKLHTFGGDDWLFHKVYEKGLSVAMCLSSPVIHYKARSRQFYTGNRKTEDYTLHEIYDVPRYPYKTQYTNSKQTFEIIKRSNKPYYQGE